VILKSRRIRIVKISVAFSHYRIRKMRICAKVSKRFSQISALDKVSLFWNKFYGGRVKSLFRSFSLISDIRTAEFPSVREPLRNEIHTFPTILIKTTPRSKATMRLQLTNWSSGQIRWPDQQRYTKIRLRNFEKNAKCENATHSHRIRIHFSQSCRIRIAFAFEFREAVAFESHSHLKTNANLHPCL